MKTWKDWVVAVMGLVLVHGCATRYAPAPSPGAPGYSIEPLGPEEAWVAFCGNGNTPSDRALDFALLRAAEWALEKGCAWFVLADVVNISSVKTYTTAPQLYRGTRLNDGSGPALLGATGVASPGTESIPLLRTESVSRPYFRPGVRLRVRLIAAPTENPSPYAAAAVRQQVRRKYGLGEQAPR
jgi:hypothetical protein